jgi:hypothetical protein
LTIFPCQGATSFPGPFFKCGAFTSFRVRVRGLEVRGWVLELRGWGLEVRVRVGVRVRVTTQ